MTTVSELLRQAAELQKRTWKAYEPIYAALGYSEFPPEHVIDTVVKSVEDAALALGIDHERIKLFRARKAIEEKRPRALPEEDQCDLCGEPLGPPDDDGVRECLECLSIFDPPGAQVAQG